MKIQKYLIESAGKNPDKEAVIAVNRRTTYQELLSGAEKVAAWLISEKVQLGEHVGILLDSPEGYISAYFGVLMAGAVVVGLNTQTTSRTLKQVIDDAEIAVLITHVKFIRYLNDIAHLRAIFLYGPAASLLLPAGIRITESDQYSNKNLSVKEKAFDSTGGDSELAQILYTSGTTGKPKGVMLSHANIMANVTSIIQYLRLSSDERHMVVLPFFYSFGNSVMLTHIAVGAALIVHQSMLFPKVVLDLLEKEKATSMSGVPSTFAILLSNQLIRKYTFPCLRYFAQAGGSLSSRQVWKIRNAFPDVNLITMYGQTEASPRLSYLPPDDFFRKPGSIGKAIPGVVLKLLDRNARPVKPGEVGEIVATGRNIMKGYWKDPEATARVLRNEGLWTGDLAKMDDEGYFYLVGRKSEMIKSGAHRIAPREIEDVLLEHPAVANAAVLGVADEILGEAIVACIIRNHGRTCTEKDLLRHCKDILPAFKVPGKIYFVETFPVSDSGKIAKKLLKNSFDAEISKRSIRSS